jgi:hypothetical protein
MATAPKNLNGCEKDGTPVVGLQPRAKINLGSP